MLCDYLGKPGSLLLLSRPIYRVLSIDNPVILCFAKKKTELHLQEQPSYDSFFLRFQYQGLLQCSDHQSLMNDRFRVVRDLKSESQPQKWLEGLSRPLKAVNVTCLSTLDTGRPFQNIDLRCSNRKQRVLRRYGFVERLREFQFFLSEYRTDDI